MCLPLASELPHGVSRETRGLTQASASAGAVVQSWFHGAELVLPCPREDLVLFLFGFLQSKSWLWALPPLDSR